MGQQDATTHPRKGKHLDENERILIEGFLKAEMSESHIAKELSRDRRTLIREVERGQAERLNSDLTKSVVYSADRAQDVHEPQRQRKRTDREAKGQQRCRGIHPLPYRHKEVVAARMKEKGMEDAVCAKTI
jgi:IS30 family transposase